MDVAGRGRTPDCHPDRAHYARGLCRPCYEAGQSKNPMPRGICPGCQQEVPLLAPIPGNRHRLPRPWRRKLHGLGGDLGQPGIVRCRYPTTLTDDEIPEET